LKKQPHEDEQQLINRMLSFKDDPLSFVRFAFPWGKPNTPLENHKGPRKWQLDALMKMRDHIAENRNRQLRGLDPELMKIARSSGRGIGKSAFLAWIALWLFSCLPSSTVVVSANTEMQLKSTTFPEIRKWATMAINSRWFIHNIMSLQPADWLVQELKRSTGYDDAYWYIQARLWSEESPDAYAGVHSQMAMAVLFDEASGIPGCIWPVAQGYFTDKTLHRFWVAISNPRNPSGEFFECFHGNRDQWDTETIDGRTVEENDKSLYDSIIRQYGEDSDQARVEVYGQFPRQGDENFMSRGAVEEAVVREFVEDRGAPLLMGVDPARMGRDKAVIRFRQGRDARSIPPLVYPKCTTAEMAEYCSTAIEKYRPDHVFIEGDGIGGPVIELLQKAGYRIIEVLVSKTAQDPTMYYLHRTEIWGRMRDWINTGSLPKEDGLISDLCVMRYSINLKGQVALWPKEKMRKEGFASSDYADALAMTFSKNVSRNDRKISRRGVKKRVARDVDFDVFS
jgi:hypothetical protein|tara:strand:+ start:499 stop:2028 length:1530 start_codon:yes stop_codon:yes gene_type:complete